MSRQQVLRWQKIGNLIGANLTQVEAAELMKGGNLVSVDNVTRTGKTIEIDLVVRVRLCES